MIGDECKRTRRFRLARLCIGLALLMFSLAGCALQGGSAPPRAENGVLDLRDRPFGESGLLPLDGKWRFEWYGTGQAAPVRSTFPVPQTWGGAAPDGGVRLSDQGRGVYKLTILHQKHSGMLAVRLPNISTAYSLYVDGEMVLSRGQPGADAQSTRPYQLPATVYFDGGTDRTELMLDVANFDHRRGGIRTELVLGTSDQIQKLVFSKESQELVVFGCLIMIGFYHFGLYALRRKESANLFFALLCLFVACRMGVIGEGLFFRWFPSLTWTAGTRLEYSAFALSALFGFAYYQRMYPNEIARRWLRASQIAGALLVAGCWLLPVLTVSAWIAAYQIYVLAISATTLTGLMIAWYRKREGARLALIGVAGLVATIVNDIFFYNGWWRSYDMVSFGLLFLIALNSLSISLRFSRTFVRAERMSLELKEWNHLLEERIAERTEQLRKSYAELEESKRGLERMEQSRRQLVSNISHDLRTPITLLQGYLEALRDGVISDPKQRDTTIRSMLTKVEGLNRLIQDLFCPCSSRGGRR
ncbi:7TM diverse intracellular signaling domain-containing protein [Cohnella thermotolerans]|uniref:7TM diverse intracellular signaling domain-containing protein n=1 Tax=Cohnella thermotolerans TaxID=329858 RepID=UPI000427E4D4|nr:7TM-DISM domain-containing protein [Cohnella thermotolerans]